VLNCSEKSTPAVLSQDKEIKSFVINSRSLKGRINNADKTVRIKSTPEINMANLTPEIQVSDGAAIEPASGTPQNFTDTFIYTVTAVDNSEAGYKVYTNVDNYILNSCLLIVHM